MKPRKFLALVICLALPGRLPVAASDDANLPDSKLSRSKVIALDKATGETIRETARPYNRGAWSTPMIWRHERGPDLVVLGNGRVYGYEPATGAEKWCVSGFAREPVAVPVADLSLGPVVSGPRWRDTERREHGHRRSGVSGAPAG